MSLTNNSFYCLENVLFLLGIPEFVATSIVFQIFFLMCNLYIKFIFLFMISMSVYLMCNVYTNV